MIIWPKPRTAGDKKEIEVERLLPEVAFNVHRFTDRPRPLANDVLLICAFSEFGCETIGTTYVIPRLKRVYNPKYLIVAGWHGREYMYRHLADEFWEIKPEFQWLRDYARAFHNESKNLKKLEKGLAAHGSVIPSDMLGKFTVGNWCLDCKILWGGMDKVSACKNCGKTNLLKSLFAHVDEVKKEALPLPRPSPAAMVRAQELVGPNPVGVFARGRRCYGRNLQPEFYADLVGRLKNKGYTPIWLGEEATTQPCPVPDVYDFSRTAEAKDLELTLAIISLCKFTVQFWTASTRLAALMGVPYLLFESSDQIYGKGQEQYRRKLCEFGQSKLVIAHYRDVFENNGLGLDLVDRAVEEMEREDYSEILGSGHDLAVTELRKAFEMRGADGHGIVAA